MMKLNFLSFLGILTFFLVLTASCASNDQEPPVVQTVIEQQESIASTDNQETIAKPEPEIIKPEPQKPATEQDAEYMRSIAAVSTSETITMDTFTQDKKEILELIDQIEVAMKSNNYSKWVSYIEPNSVRYWQSSKNLKEIEGRLPVKGIKIKTMQDYFKYIFIPARTDRNVDEIRYISGSLVKAVQVQGETDIIYYTFEKINGKWMLKLDTLS